MCVLLVTQLVDARAIEELIVVHHRRLARTRQQIFARRLGRGRGERGGCGCGAEKKMG
jgi:hypothetical protein